MAQNNNFGNISRVKDKKKSSHADARGSCNIEGVEYWINGWSKTGKYGPYMSLSFKKKQASPGGKPNDKKPEENGKSALPEEKKDEKLF